MDGGVTLGTTSLSPLNGSSVPGASAGEAADFDQDDNASHYSIVDLLTVKLSSLPLVCHSEPGWCALHLALTSAGFLVATLQSGDHNVSATFSGNENYTGSTSFPLIITAGKVCNLSAAHQVLHVQLQRHTRLARTGGCCWPFVLAIWRLASVILLRLLTGSACQT